MQKTNNITVEQLRELITRNKISDFSLIDVREQWEYEESRIPGSMLVPLSELHQSLSKLDRNERYIIYCHSGSRSMAATQFLEGQGFFDVKNLLGGMVRWSGETAMGPIELGMLQLTGKETVREILEIAQGMEKSLKLFYSEIQHIVINRETAILIEYLVNLEAYHEKKIAESIAKLPVSRTDENARLVESTFAEGGLYPENFIKGNEAALENGHYVLQLALTFETQALDLYMRYAHKYSDENITPLFLFLAQEEKDHVKLIGDLLKKWPTVKNSS